MLVIHMHEEDIIEHANVKSRMLIFKVNQLSII